MSDVPEAQLRDPPRPVPAEEGEGTARTLSVRGRRVRVGGGTREQGRPHRQLPEKAVALPLLLILCLTRGCREQQVVELWAEMSRMEERVGERVAAEVRGMKERVGERVGSEVRAVEGRL